MPSQIPCANVSQLAAVIQHGHVWSDIRDVRAEGAKVRVVRNVSARINQLKERSATIVLDLRGLIKISKTLIEEALGSFQRHVRIGILRDPDG